MLAQADNTGMRKFLCWTLFGLLLHGLPVQAANPPKRMAAHQSHADIRAAVENFVRAQTRTLPGQANIRVGEIDRRVVLPACATLETFLPPGGQLLGNSTVGVRCAGASPWKLFVTVHVTISASLLVTSRPLQLGHVLRAEDLSRRSGELTHAGMLTDSAQAIGKVLKFGIGAGQTLKQDMLRAPHVVTQGQTVQLQIEEQGFSVRAEGQALHNASEGESIQIKTASGRVVTGIAREGGLIEVRTPKTPASSSP